MAAVQSIDRAIINPAFMATFLGALVLTALAALLHLAGEGRSLLPWIVVALVLDLVVFMVTIRVNVCVLPARWTAAAVQALKI